MFRTERKRERKRERERDGETHMRDEEENFKISTYCTVCAKSKSLLIIKLTRSWTLLLLPLSVTSND